MKKGNLSEALTWDEFIRVQEELRASGKWRELLAWAIGGYTAFRVSDFMSLTWEDIEGDRISVIESKTKHLSKSARTVAFGPEIKAIFAQCKENLNKYGHPDRPLFPRRRGPAAKSPSVGRENMSRFISKIARDHGIKTQCSPHSLRKCFALRVWTMLGANEPALMVVAKMIGHNSVETTKIYLGITRRVTDEIYRSLYKGIEVKPGYSHLESIYRNINKTHG